MKKSKIVRILAASALFTLGLAATSFAAMGDKEIDISIGLATAPNSAFDTGLNLSVGGGYEMLKIQAIKGSTLQIRGDIGYNRWEDSEFGDDITFTRVPVSAGARLYIPIEGVKGLRVYGEASLELSFDEVDLSVNVPGLGSFGDSSSETNVGLVPGAGVEFDVAPNIFVRGGLKHHLIEDSYLNASVGIGFKF